MVCVLGDADNWRPTMVDPSNRLLACQPPLEQTFPSGEGSGDEGMGSIQGQTMLQRCLLRRIIAQNPSKSVACIPAGKHISLHARQYKLVKSLL